MSLAAPSSLFIPVANSANVTIEYDAEDYVSVDANGFPIMTTSTVELRARVYGGAKKAADLFPDGADLHGELLMGRLNDPLTFPETIADLAVVRLTFDDGRTGTGRIRIKTQNPLSGNALGQKFALLYRGS